MATFSATNAKQKFAEVLDQAQRESVRIQRHDRDVAVIVSVQEYDRLQGNQWSEFWRIADQIAEEAKANGFTEADLQEILAER